MNQEDIKSLLTKLRERQLSVDEAFDRLKNLPYENLGFANIDHHRSIGSWYRCAASVARHQLRCAQQS